MVKPFYLDQIGSLPQNNFIWIKWFGGRHPRGAFIWDVKSFNDLNGYGFIQCEHRGGEDPGTG